MWEGVRGRLFVVLAAGVGALVLAWSAIAGSLIERGAVMAAEDQLRAAAEHVVRELDRPGADPDRIAEWVGAQRGARVEVIEADGTVSGDTAREGRGLPRERVSPEPELDGARADGDGVAHRRDARGTRRIYVALAHGERVVRVSRPEQSAQGKSDAFAVTIVFALLFGIALALALAAVLSRTLLDPLEGLTHASDALARGDLGARMRSDRSDEIGRLERAFDRMAENLASQLAALKREEARLRTVLDAMDEAVLVTDREGRIQLYNRAMAQLAGTPPRGRTTVEAIRSAELHEAVGLALRGKASSVELEIAAARDRSRRVLVARVAALPENAGAVAVLHDVTELKRADQIRRDFVANASHELRTPLTAIRGFAETLRDGAIEDPGISRRFLDMILEHSKRLERLTQDLLELSRSESGGQRLPVVPLDVLAIAGKAARGLTVHAADRRVDLAVETEGGPVRAMADERALDQVLMNLIDNAVKYAGEGGKVRVRARVENGTTVLEVVDTGPGIEPWHQTRIFERFYRVDAGRAREVGGTGLGLAIVKHLVQRMGGEVGVTSQPGNGSTFWVRLRAADGDPGRANDHADDTHP